MKTKPNGTAKLRIGGPRGAGRQPGRQRLAGHRLLAGLGLLFSLAGGAARAQAPVGDALASPSDEQSYRKELVFGVNFNTQGALIGGAALRSARVLDERWLRFWSLEGVMLKDPKEQRVGTIYGGTYVYGKANHAFSLRPSFGMQRILFRKAADSGVQINGLVSAGPSLGLLMPYYISYDRTPSPQSRVPQFYVEERYDPAIHSRSGVTEDLIVDRASLFAGAGQTRLVPGAHLRAALSFEYGRYRDAVAGLETGFLLEAFTKPMVILTPPPSPANVNLNRKFFPSVYLTLYFGQRS